MRLEQNEKLYDAYLEHFQDISQLEMMNLGFLKGIKSTTDQMVTAEELLSNTKVPKLDISVAEVERIFERPATYTAITMDFKREVELNMLDWYYNYPDKVLYVEGARQTGKTYTIKKFIQTMWGSLRPQEDVYTINLMSEEFSSKLRQYRNTRQELQYRDDGTVKNGIETFAEYCFPEFDSNTAKVLYIDEIQEDAGIYNSIREFARECKCRLIVSGSYLNVVSNAKLGNNKFKPPAGGSYTITMRSLSFIEFLEANGVINSQTLLKSVHDYTEKDHLLFDEVQKLYQIYLQIGGYPEVVKTYIKTQAVEQSFEVLEELIRNYFNESKPYLAMCNPVIEFESTFVSILEIMTNVSKRHKLKDIAVEIKNTLKRNKKTVNETDICSTLSWLESGGFLKAIRRYKDISLRDYASGQRYYFYDLGVANYVAHNSIIPESEWKGYVAENFAFLQIMDAYPKEMASPLSTLGYLDIVQDSELGNAELDFVYKDISSQTIPIFCLRFYCLLDEF